MSYCFHHDVRYFASQAAAAEWVASTGAWIASDKKYGCGAGTNLYLTQASIMSDDHKAKTGPASLRYRTKATDIPNYKLLPSKKLNQELDKAHGKERKNWFAKYAGFLMLASRSPAGTIHALFHTVIMFMVKNEHA